MRKIILSIVVLAAISLPANRLMAQATVNTAGAANIVDPVYFHPPESVLKQMESTFRVQLQSARLQVTM